jgi:hypothetical protein
MLPSTALPVIPGATVFSGGGTGVGEGVGDGVGAVGVTGGCDVVGAVGVPAGGATGDDGFGLGVVTQRWTLMYTIRP